MHKAIQSRNVRILVALLCLGLLGSELVVDTALAQSKPGVVETVEELEPDPYDLISEDELGACTNFTGTDDRDVIAGTPKCDKIAGWGGDDVISSANGPDDVSGGDGGDRIRAGNARDEASGGNGADSVFGDARGDTVSGGSGNDTIDGEGGWDSVLDTNPNDTDFACGGTGDDSVNIQDGDSNDTGWTEAGSDTMTRDSADTVFFDNECGSIGI